MDLIQEGRYARFLCGLKNVMDIQSLILYPLKENGVATSEIIFY